MNINGFNLTTLLSAGVEGIRQLNSEAAGGGEFGQALMTQLGQLPLPLQNLDKLSEETMQDIAALLGNKLPIAAKLENDIDLDETLTALKAVIQHIEAATATQQAAIPKLSGLLDEEEKAWQDPDIVSGALQWLSENRDNPVHAAMSPGIIQNAIESGLPYQETGGAAASVGKNSHNFLQSLAHTGVMNDEVMTDAQQTFEAKLTERSAVVPEKFDIADQKQVPQAGDKMLAAMAAEGALLNKQSVIEHKLEVPAMTRPFAHPDWGQELGERILWMNNKSIPVAELRLNPQHLGPVSIRINMDHDQASIAFSAQHASVRDAIEAAVPKLREMFGAQQLHLAEINVSQPSTFDQGKSPGFGQMAQQQQNDGGQHKGAGAGAFDPGSHLVELADATEGARTVLSNGILNLFA